MKIAAGFLLCLGTALSWQVYEDSYSFNPTQYYETINDAIEEQNEFSQGRQTTYLYNSQAMTGIPGTSKQHSGNRLQAKVTVTCKHQTTCVLEMHEPRMGRLNRHVAKPKSLLPTSAFEPIPLEPQQRLKLRLPVRFSYINGEISQLYFDGQERPWSANIKRGVLNLLQVKLNPKQAQSSMDIVDEVEDQLLNSYKPSPRDAQFYRTMENTIEGQCEATYTVITPPEFKQSRQPIVNVTKTINFEKCSKRPELKLNFHFNTPCKTCENKYNEDQKFLKSSSISTYQVIKTSKANIVNNAQTESQYVFVPFSEESNTIVTYVSQNMRLLRVGVPTYRVKVPMNPIKSNTDMLYNMDAGIGRERFQMTGDSSFLEKVSCDKRENKVQVAKDLLKKLINNIQDQVQEPATSRFTELVNLLRLMPKHQIEQVHRSIEQGQVRIPTGRPGQTKQAMDLFHDALGSAGTMSAVQHLVQKIKQRQITVQKAVSAMKNLRTMRVPSDQIIQELISLAKSPVAQRHHNLKQATWLTIGSLMHILCATNSDQWSIESQESIKNYCPTSQKQEYVKILLKKLHSSHKWEDQLIFVKALSNAGIDLSIFELEKIAQNKNFNYRNMIRSEAILAMRHLVQIMPKKIQKVLMPIVANKLESEDVRITAVYMVLQTMPKRNILDQLAKLSHEERSLQVASYIDSSMRTLANTTNPCEKEFANDLKLSLHQSHKIYTRPANSKLNRIKLHSLKQRLGVDLDFGTSFKGESPLPRQMAAVLNANYLGFWKKQLLGVKLSTEGLEQLFEQLEDNEYFQGQQSWNKLTSPIDALSGIQRNAPSKQPKAVLSFKLKNQEEGFWALKQETIESMLTMGRPVRGQALEVAQKLRRGITVNYNKATMLEEILFKVPTTMGMPVMVHVKVPAVLNVHGAIKVTPGPSGSYGAFQVKALLKPSLVASISVDAQVWSPIIATGVTVVSKVKVQQPIDAKLQINLKHATKKVNLLFKAPTQQKDLITIETRPTTFTIVQPKQVLAQQSKQKRLILGEEGQRVETINKCMNTQSLGSFFCVKGQYHKTPEHSQVGTTFAPLSGPNKIVLSVEPTSTRPSTVVVNFYGKFLQPATTGLFQKSSLFHSMPFFGQESRRQQFSDLFENTFSNQYTDSLFGEEQFSPMVDSLMAQTARKNKVQTRNYFLKDTNSKRPLVNSLRVEIENDKQQQKSTFDLTHVFNMDGDFQKVQAKLSQAPSAQYPQQYKACLNYENVFPTMEMTRHLRNGQTIGKLQLNWGQTCQSNNFITAIKRIEKGQHSELHQMQTPEWEVYRDANLKHGQLLKKSPLKHIIDINYNNVPLKTKTMLDMFLRRIQKRYQDQTLVSETLVQNRPKHVKIILAFDPQTLKQADVLIKTPKSNTLIKNMNLPTYATPVTHKNDYYKNLKKSFTREALQQPSGAQCYASEYEVKTFQDTKLPLPQSQSFKVLAQDCQSNLYTVLMRRMTSRQNLKEVKIQTPRHQITLRPSHSRPDKVHVFINGRDQSKQNHIVKTLAGVPILKVIRQNSHVKVELLNAGISVYFDRKSVNVEVPPHKRHSQCGICSSSSFNSLSQKFFSNRFESEMEPEQMILDQFSTRRQFSPLADFSSSQDVMSYYFNVNPFSQQKFENELELEVEELERESIMSSQPLSRFWQDSESQREQQHGWTRPEQREWEIKGKSSKQDKRQEEQFFGSNMWQRDVEEEMNEEFSKFYSPLDKIEQQINQQLAQESFLPEDLEQEREFTRNPYLNRNFFISAESCQYMPFWQREASGCNQQQQRRDIFSEWEQNVQESDIYNPLIREESRFGQESLVEEKIEREIEQQQIFRNEEQLEGWNRLERVEDDEEIFQQDQFFGGRQQGGRKNKIVETQHEICFSARPIRCPDDSAPEQDRKETVQYVCLSRKSQRAQKFLNEITSGKGVVRQLASMTPTMSRQEIVPTVCRPSF